jgi:hypothetical protein
VHQANWLETHDDADERNGVVRQRTGSYPTFRDRMRGYLRTMGVDAALKKTVTDVSLGSAPACRAKTR